MASSPSTKWRRPTVPGQLLVALRQLLALRLRHAVRSRLNLVKPTEDLSVRRCPGLVHQDCRPGGDNMRSSPGSRPCPTGFEEPSGRLGSKILPPARAQSRSARVAMRNCCSLPRPLGRQQLRLRDPLGRRLPIARPPRHLPSLAQMQRRHRATPLAPQTQRRPPDPRRSLCHCLGQPPRRCRCNLTPPSRTPGASPTPHLPSPYLRLPMGLLDEGRRPNPHPLPTKARRLQWEADRRLRQALLH